MSVFALLSVLVSLAALFGFISHRVLRLPTTIGTTVLALFSSSSLIVFSRLLPGMHNWAAATVQSIDFNQVVLHGMLALLLFAGALQLDLEQLGKEKLPVFLLSIFSTVISTIAVAAMLKLILHVLGIPSSTLSCLLFGALISPTDPIAVLELLRRVGAPPELQTQLAGESLFNDGVGAVIFLALLNAASGGSLPSPAHFLTLLVLKSCGAIGLGLALGYLVYRLICMVDSYRVEVLLTLALAMGGYAAADVLHLSAPLEAVAAGLLVSGRARSFAMSSETRENVDKFWELIDDIMNVVLFLLLGLELLVLPLQARFLVAGLIAIPAVLFVRWVSVGSVISLLRYWRQHTAGSVRVLTWAGLRGGLAIALALSLAPGPERKLLLVITYVIVVFSIVVQGLTVGALLRHLKIEKTEQVQLSR